MKNPLASILGPNWAPKVFGVLFALAIAIKLDPTLVAFLGVKASAQLVGWSGLLVAAFGSGFAATVKGAGVTGGTVAATPEAADRVARDKASLPPAEGKGSGFPLGTAAAFLLIGVPLLAGCAELGSIAKKAEAVAANPVVQTVSSFGAQVLGQEAALVAVKNIQGDNIANVGSAAAEVLYQAFTPAGQPVDSATLDTLIQQAASDYGLGASDANQVGILVSSLISQAQPALQTYPNLAADFKDFVYGAELYFNSHATVPPSAT